jgi:hypothetical protein
MVNFNDALESFSRQQEYLDRMMNPPTLKALSNQQNLLSQLNVGNIDSVMMQYHRSFSNAAVTMDKWSRSFDSSLFNLSIVNMAEALSKSSIGLSNLNFDPLMQSLTKLSTVQIDFFNKYPDINKMMFTQLKTTTDSLNWPKLFGDVTLDNLNVISEILSETSSKIEGETVQEMSLTVGNMSKAELRTEITQIILEAQQNLSKNMPANERIRTFFNGVITGVGQDVAKWIMLGLLQFLAYVIFQIAADNHDYEIGKQISEKINETDIVKSVKKSFINNPEIEPPIGELAFLRIESNIRTRPSKQAHFVSNTPVLKNTVVFPVDWKGKWVLIEIETNEGFYTGWVEESKVIKFKLEGNKSN